jgi:ribose transport system ATP-binding protein
MTSANGHERRDDEIVSLRNGRKRYGAFTALADVSLTLRRGEVHMMLGENGAGKSTLVSLLTGAAQLDGGELYIHGELAQRHSPTAARRAGINAVLQDFSLAPALSVVENYFLNREETKFGILRKANMRAKAAGAMTKLGIDLNVDKVVAELSRAEQQILEIVRALGGQPGVLILDEPTATLSHDESERLFGIVAQLKGEGWAILYVTHRLEEMRRLGDMVTVLRNGERISVHPLKSVTDEQLVREMVGRPLAHFYPTIASQPAQYGLVLQDVVTSDRKLKNVNINVRRGEIVGLGGLVGCGKGEVGRAAFGLSPVISGVVELEGREIRGLGQRELLRQGLVYMPQDRRGEALALNRSIGENIALEAICDPPYSVLGWIRSKHLQKLLREIVVRLDVRPANVAAQVDSLSGGNQQKVVLGRALTRLRAVYIFEEPTAGVDVGARFEFYTQLKGLCEAGAAILLITSDLQELIHLSHRIYVMHGGQVAAELVGCDRTEEKVVRYAFGE